MTSERWRLRTRRAALRVSRMVWARCSRRADGGFVAAGPGDGGAVDGGVDLAVAAAAEAVDVAGSAGAGGGGAVVAGVGGRAAEAPDVAGLAYEAGGG